MAVEQRKAVYLVQGQKIIYSKKDSYSGSLLTNTLGVYEFEFRTDSEWTEFDKVALYLQATGVQPIYIELTDTAIATCTTGADGNKIYKVPVPEQMLTKAGQLTVGLIGYYSNQDDFRFPTNTDSSYRIAASVQPLDGKQYPQYISIMEQILLRLYKGQGGSTEDLTELRRQVAELNQLLVKNGDGTQFLSNNGTYKEIEKTKYAFNSKHAALGAEVLTEWNTPLISVMENYTLEDGIYRFRFRKGIDAEPSNWWATILSCNIGVTTNLSGKKLLACFSQRTDEGYLKFKKICISNKSGNWSTAYDVITDFSNDRLYVVVDLDEVLGSGIFEVADGKNLYLVAGGTSGNAENPKMNTHNIDWSATAAIIDKDVLNGIGVSQFFGKYTPNDISKLTNDISKLNNDVSNLAGQVGAKEKYITCWGDSLTAMGGWTTKLQELSGFTVYNGGVGGENTKTIVARQGGDAIVLNNITIPGNGTPVEIAKYTDGGIDTVLGNKVTPALQSNSNLNPVDVNGVECSLKWTGASYSDTAGTWTIKRKTIGDDIVINRPTAVRTAFDRLYNDPYLMIIFIGQNKGYDDDYEILVEQHKRIIEHANAKHVIVLGLHSGDTASRTDYETRMKKEFGRYFISLREYLAHPIYGSDGSTIVSCYGIDDQGLVADTAYSYGGKTYNSLEEIAIGKVPHQILRDGLHFSSGTRTVIGNLIYKRCKELNIF